MNRLDAEQIERQARLATEIAARMAELFERCPELCGFAVHETQGLPVRVDDSFEENLFVTEVELYPRADGPRYSEICDEIGQTLGEIVAERPEAFSFLCGRSFARALQ